MTGIEYMLLHVQEPILYVIRKVHRQAADRGRTDYLSGVKGLILHVTSPLAHSNTTGRLLCSWWHCVSMS